MMDKSLRLPERAHRLRQEAGQADRAGGIRPEPRRAVFEHQVADHGARPLLWGGVRPDHPARAPAIRSPAGTSGPGAGAGRAANPDYWWKPGNDFVGDPPQEEQGLYSVFDSDASSLLLIKEYADKLHAIKR
jgi:hypothetical protein